MKHTFAVLLFPVCLGVMGMTGAAQIAVEDPANMSMTAAQQGSTTSVELARELCLARKAGNAPRVRELEEKLWQVMPTVPEVFSEVVTCTGPGAPLAKTTAPLWGNDCKVYSGQLYSPSKRQLATDADTVGGIYVALNAALNDSVSQLRAYRSTNGGADWSFVGSIHFPGHQIQSFDMCVTDTSGGKWAIMFAIVRKSDNTANGGGMLHWAKLVNDGSGWQSGLIRSASTSTAYRNPTICTDGAKYPPNSTYHYVACEFITPSTDESRGILVTHTTNWGTNWSAPDTNIRGNQETTPVIAIDWSTGPDSLCLAFARFPTGNREIRMARNSLTFHSSWGVAPLFSSVDCYDPSLALDPVRGVALVTYTRQTTPTNRDAMCIFSNDFFKSYTVDSIATSSANEELTSASFAPYGSGYYWRVAYRSSAGNDSIFYKGLYNSNMGFHAVTRSLVSQYRPSSVISPVVGFDRDLSGTYYRGNCIYAGYGPTDVYFDAVDLAVDVPMQTELPGTYALFQNYPNPFNPKTGVRFEVPGVSDVKITVYDLLGREVAVLVNEKKQPGTYEVSFDGAGLASGMYIYRLTAGSFTQSRTMLLLK